MSHSLLLMAAIILLTVCVAGEVNIHQVIGRTSLQRTLACIDIPESSHGRVFGKKVSFCLCGERCLKLARIFVIQQVDFIISIRNQYRFCYECIMIR